MIKSQNWDLRCAMINNKYHVVVETLEIGPSVEDGLRSKGRGCFELNFIRTL